MPQPQFPFIILTTLCKILNFYLRKYFGVRNLSKITNKKVQLEILINILLFANAHVFTL
jgi:hypothetical protein